MKWNYETFGQKQERLGQWKKWFAWYPVELTYYTTVVWLEFVERRYTFCGYWDAEYRELTNGR